MASEKPLFLLGAGFNVDAATEVGPLWGESIYQGRYPLDVKYPLVSDLSKLCFKLSEPPKGKSIEDLFSDAIQSQDHRPIEALAQRLREADNYLADKLTDSSTRLPNRYSSFFLRFAGCDFLTFNYDGLAEIALLRLGQWTPADGYGVDARIDRNPFDERPTPESSSSRVLHLHGSLYLRTERFIIQNRMIERRGEPEYWFDPDGVAGFGLFSRAHIQGRSDPLDEIIAPVPNKADARTRPYVERAYKAAEDLARGAAPLICIGYRFSKHDRVSYDPILRAVQEGSRRVLIVARDASSSRQRLSSAYRSLSIETHPEGFADWVRSGFPHAAP